MEIPTHVAVKRIDTGTYRVDANVGFSITQPDTGASNVRFTPDEGSPLDLTVTNRTGTITVSISTAQLGGGQGVLEIHP